MGNIDREADEFFKQEEEKAVDALHEALWIDRFLKICAGHIEKGFLQMDMPLIEALEKLEKRKFELIGIDPEEQEKSDDERE